MYLLHGNEPDSIHRCIRIQNDFFEAMGCHKRHIQLHGQPLWPFSVNTCIPMVIPLNACKCLNFCEAYFAQGLQYFGNVYTCETLLGVRFSKVSSALDLILATYM